MFPVVLSETAEIKELHLDVCELITEGTQLWPIKSVFSQFFGTKYDIGSKGNYIQGNKTSACSKF